MRRLIVLSLVFACLAFAGRAGAASPKKPGRSLAMGGATGTAILLDEMQRADKRRRDDILKMEMEAERRERSDRVVIFGVVAIAVTALVMVEKRRRTPAKP